MPKKQYEYQHTTQEYVTFVNKQKQLQKQGTGDTQDSKKTITKAEIFDNVVSYIAIIILFVAVIIPMILVGIAVFATNFKVNK